MKEYKKSQYGWTVVHYYEDQKVYSVIDKDELSYLIPEEIWDSLASAVIRADNYRKSRDHFRESRDTEKQKCTENLDRINAHYRNLHKDLNDMNHFLSEELTQLEHNNRVYKTLLWVSGIFGVVALLSHYIV